MNIKIILLCILLISAPFIKSVGQSLKEQIWHPEIKLALGQSFRYNVVNKNTVAGNLGANRNTEERYAMHFQVIEKAPKYYILSVEYIYHDTTVNNLFDFLRKIVQPTFEIRLDVEQATLDVANDTEVISYIDQYVKQQNEEIEASANRKSLKTAIQSADKENILYAQLFADIHQILGHFLLEEITIQDTLQYVKPVYSELINKEVDGDARFYVKDYHPNEHISLIEEVAMPDFGDLFLEHTQKVLEDLKTAEASKTSQKPIIKRTAAITAIIDLKSSLATSLSNKVTLELNDGDGFIHNEMELVFVLQQ